MYRPTLTFALFFAALALLSAVAKSNPAISVAASGLFVVAATAAYYYYKTEVCAPLQTV